MFDTVWVFLKDPGNQAVLGWIGGGIAAVAAALWIVIKFFANKPSVRADNGGVAVGRDNVNSPVNIDTRHSGKR